jgi:hypothetical protein
MLNSFIPYKVTNCLSLLHQVLKKSQNFRGALQKAEITPDNLNRIMPAEGEIDTTHFFGLHITENFAQILL